MLPDDFLGVPKGGAVFGPAAIGWLGGSGPAGGGVPEKPVGADRAAAEAAASAAGATGAPPTCASIGEPPGREAAAALAAGPCDTASSMLANVMGEFQPAKGNTAAVP